MAANVSGVDVFGQQRTGGGGMGLLSLGAMCGSSGRSRTHDGKEVGYR